MQHKHSLPAVLAAAFALSACSEPPSDVAGPPAFAVTQVSASGGGHYALTLGDVILPGKFGFTANQRDASGAATGHIHHVLDFAGELIEFNGEVTCLTTDPVEGRAWIGGVITRNASAAEPYASDERYQVGHDIWFRVLDSGQGHGAVDRTTFVGFEGDAGFPTSAAYCTGMPWPAGNARTWPVTSGNIQVR